MDVTFLGGANEIGASCAIVDFAGCRLMVDCGQRLQAKPSEALPDFSFLEHGPPLSAVLITHAHTDHIGGLPALEPFLDDDCPIYATEATVGLARVMLADSQRIQAHYRQGDGQVPLFPPGAVAGVLDHLEEVPWGKPIRVGDTGVHATWFPSGHILGAGMIELRDRDESVVFSGDLSISDQRTVSGAFLPRLKPQLMVLESTYGDRQHAHRPAQEDRIVDHVARTIDRGGSVLFPSFALGRAQEVMVVLAEAIRRGDLPEIPIWADGMVRAISSVYAEFPDDLSPPCRRIWEHGYDPIFPEDLTIRPVKDSRKRERIAKGPPCVVVASSGMLQGGASQFYARHWLGDRDCCVILTGYQDEESPGQALLDLASLPDDEPRYFLMGGVPTEVRCQVEHVSLTAHADAGELVGLSTKLSPQQILLVHGSDEARQSLASQLLVAGIPQVDLPNTGDHFEPDAPPVSPSGRDLLVRQSPLAHWPPWDPMSERELELARFHEWLVSLTPKIEWITLEELGEVWKSPRALSEDDKQELRQAIYQTDQRYFVPNRRHPYVLSVTPPERLQWFDVRPQPTSVELTTTQLTELFPETSGLKRFGFFPNEAMLELEFAFPEQARRQYAERLRDFSVRTGWTIAFRDRTPEQQTDDLRALLTQWMGEASARQAIIDHTKRQVKVESVSLTTFNDDDSNSTNGQSSADVDELAPTESDPFVRLDTQPEDQAGPSNRLFQQFERATGYRLVDSESH